MKLLQTFVVTARMLNFRKAADRLFLAQPTVTQHVRHLENELRVQLFERSSRRVRLTPAGERFMEYATRVLDLYQQGVQELTSFQQGYRERLVLAVSPLIARSTLSQVVKRFTLEQPDVEVVVQIALSPDIAPMVTEGRAHLGLSRTKPTSRDLTSFVWYEDPVILAVPNDGVITPRTPWQDVLDRNRLLTQNHPGYWDDLLLAIHNLGIRVRTMEVSLVDITKLFIAEGLGVSFLPLSTVWEEIERKRMLGMQTLGLELPTTATHVLYPAVGASRPVKAFMQVLPPLSYVWRE